ncbi:MAG: BatD family protein, partial [Chitinophagales bacterium]|nr:BatD family protein [Chitinophagales bacterium]
ILSDNQVYQGERVTAVLRLYFNYNLANLQLSKGMGLEGFWNQEIQLDPNQRPRVEEYNGKKYHVVDIQKFNLFPQRSGTLKIAPAEISAVAQVPVRSNRRNFWGFMGMNLQNVSFKLQSNEAVLQVKELPMAGRPAGFNGAVGEYTFTAKLSATKAKTDEGVTYSVVINGTGNLKFVDFQKLQLPTGIEVFDPKVKENISNTEKGISGTKQYDFLLIPRQPGDYTIPSTEFAYFNPKAQKYVVIKSPEFSLSVTGTPSTASSVIPSGSAAPIQSLEEDIRFIKTSLADKEKNVKLLPASIGFGVAYGSPFLLFLGLLALKRRKEAMELDVAGTKRRKALSVARKRLATAQKHMKAGNKKEFYDEVSRALWGFLADKFFMGTGELSKEHIAEKLSEKNVPADLIQRLQALLNTCDIALYAPVSEVGRMEDNYRSALELIADLENQLK